MFDYIKELEQYIAIHYIEPEKETASRGFMAAMGQAMAAPFMKMKPAIKRSAGQACMEIKKSTEECTEEAPEFTESLEEKEDQTPVELTKCRKLPPMSEKRSRNLEDVINDLEKTFMELVFSFADRKGMSDVELQKKANIDRKAFSKLKCGTTKNPSKPTALALAIALELNLDETKDLLSRAGLALSPCSRQDVIVQFFIEKEAYDIFVINEALYAHGEAML